MDNFIVSARKYRPATFQTVVGQQHITNTLKNAIKNNQLAQAFLFCGPRGVGKTTCARILAKTINCENLSEQAEACGICHSCQTFQNGNSFSIHELDAASNNSVDDIRSLIEQVRIPPQTGKYKIYIIDEVHMLSQSAFNAFLKTLEEPPSYAIFILATTEKHKILPTILSRCQIFDFNRIKVDDMAGHLAEIAVKESVNFDTDGLHLIAQKADGGLRDALSMFDQIVSFSNKNVTYKSVIENLNILDYDYYFQLTDALLQENVPGSLVIFDEILANGFDGNHFITGLASHFRNLLVTKDEITLKLLEVSEGIKQRYLKQSQETSTSFLISSLNIANQCDLNYRISKNQRLQVELALIKLCHIPSVLNFSKIPANNILTVEPVKKKFEPLVKDLPPIKNSIELKMPESKADSPEGPVLSPPAVEVNQTEENNVLPEKVLEKLKINLPKIGYIQTDTIIPNLNDLTANYNKKEEQKIDYVQGETKEEFSTDTLLKLWNQYAQKIKLDGKLNIFTLMTAYQPVLLENFLIELIIENKIQDNQLASEKIDLLNFLRVQLKNFSVDIITKQAEKSNKKHLYTSTEKYLHMVEKNPHLEDFKKNFNLELD
ncbi:MAG: DNA polymerase III subunit gamma/tau [Flavobacterium sp.]|nr:DNA polymerase III subunit gamma/tau [Pedobacter sp.]